MLPSTSTGAEFCAEQIMNKTKMDGFLAITLAGAILCLVIDCHIIQKFHTKSRTTKAYFPIPYGSWVCCAEAFALDARNQIAARAIDKQITQKIRVLAFQNRACELLRPRCRIVVARAIRALPVRTCLFAARAPRAVRCGGEGTADPPFERELLVPARPWRRPEQAPPCWKVVIPTAGRLHGRAGAISRSDGSAVPWCLLHRTSRHAARARRTGTYVRGVPGPRGRLRFDIEVSKARRHGS